MTFVQKSSKNAAPAATSAAKD